MEEQTASRGLRQGGEDAAALRFLSPNCHSAPYTLLNLNWLESDLTDLNRIRLGMFGSGQRESI